MASVEDAAELLNKSERDAISEFLKPLTQY
jgi:hypothetical protein